MSLTKRLLPLVCLVLPLPLGCSGDDAGRLTVYPTTGTVLVNGQGIAGAQVTLMATTDDLKSSAAPIPFGTTDQQGHFTPRSYEPRDGAPAGRYQVKIVWPETPPPGADTEMYEAKDQFKGRYQDHEKSGLTATIEKGSNELPPFELRR